MNRSVKYSIVIPVHNEAENLTQLIEELEASFGSRQDVEVIFIDDCSTDSTLERLQKISLATSLENFRVLTQCKRSGQSQALGRGFQESLGDFIIRMDGDLQDHPRDVKSIMEKLADGHDLVVGLRAIRSHRKLLRVQSMIFDTLCVLILDSPFHSSVASMVGFRAALIQSERMRKNSNRFLVLIALRNGAKNPAEIIVSHRPRTGGVSKYRLASKIISGGAGSLVFLAREGLRRWSRRS